MIFTMGYAENYDLYLKSEKTPHKIGPSGPGQLPAGYLGGIAFETEEDGRAYISRFIEPERWGVYSLDGDWHRDTYQIEGENFRRITRDLRILGKV